MKYKRENILKSLSQYKGVKLNETPLSAAVLIILLYDTNNNLEIVLTKRASDLPTYAGHYSFPGGMRDANDIDLFATAKREVQEELNLSPNSYQYVGNLDDFMSHDGHLVRPFVVEMKKSSFIKWHKKSDQEIEEIYYFNFKKLEEIKDEPRLYPITTRRPSYAFSEGRVFIWGLTAVILVHLLQVSTEVSIP